MTGHEDEAEQVVADVLVDYSARIGPLARHLNVAPERLMLAFERLAASNEVDRAMLGRPHQPGAGLLRYA